MKHSASLCRLFLFPLLLFTLACSTIPAFSQPEAVLSFAPDDSITVSPDALDEAGQVLQKRLDDALTGKATVSVSGNTLQVAVTQSEDITTTVRLAAEIGELVFWGSTAPLVSGAPIPSDVEAVLTDRDILNAQADSFTGKWAINVTFTDEGARKLADYTTAHIGEYMIIGRDGIVFSSPKIMAPITGGQAIVEKDFDEQEAKLLAAQLNSGRLPFYLKLIEAK